jgi:hypothetical protein
MSDSHRDRFDPREETRGIHSISWGGGCRLTKHTVHSLERKTFGSYRGFSAHDETLPNTLSRVPMGKRKHFETWALRHNYLQS